MRTRIKTFPFWAQALRPYSFPRVKKKCVGEPKYLLLITYYLLFDHSLFTHPIPSYFQPETLQSDFCAFIEIDKVL